MSKKVLFVATVVKKHINVFHLPYLQWFQEQGYETHVCARDDFDGEECIIPYCDVHYDIPFERSPISSNNIEAYKELERIINENEYDIIHCHTPVAAMLTRLAAIEARKKGTRVIYTAHGFHFFKGAPLINWLVYYPVEWVCSWFTDVLITINQEDYQLAKKRMKAKSIEYVNGIGVDIQKGKNTTINRLIKRNELEISEEDIMLLSVGELSKRKNHEIVIRALAKLKNKKIQYVICGQGPLQKYLEQLCIELGIKEQVIFTGFRRDVIEICKSADIFVFPSLQEGLPVALMEAMMAGLPCIVSKIRGNTDLIQQGKGGIICNPKSSKEFQSAIEELIMNRDIRIMMGNENISNIREFDIYSVKRKMQEVYEH